MKKRFKKIILCITLLLISIFTISNSKFNVLAEDASAYKTYTVDSSNNLIPTQNAYLAVKNLNKLPLTNSSILTLSNPDDLYFEEVSEQFFIADKGNKRIVVLNSDLSSGISVGEGILKIPQGVFANENGDIYVADYGLKEVVIFKNGFYDDPIFVGKPTHPLYTESSQEFLPSKIVVDNVGTMYIIDSGNSNGIVTITNDLEFSGYFGANYVRPTFSYILKFLFSSKEQKKKLYVSPISPKNLAIDYDGLINTISSTSGSAVKKLNIAGTNLFPTNMYDFTTYCDIAIGPNKTIYTVGEGSIVEYDQEGNLLFSFAGYESSEKYNGLFKNVTSIEVDNDNCLYVLDGNNIQIFAPTAFSTLVHEALNLYYDGKYAESRVPWEEALKMNNMFDLAHKGLGNAYLRETNYKEALAEFKLAKDSTAYSDAFWEVRNDWLKTYGYALFIVIVCLIIIIFVLNKLHLLDKFKESLRKLKDKIFKIKFIKEVCYVTKFIRHPLDGFYEVKFHNAMGVLPATFLYIWFFVLNILVACFTGFAFNTVDKETISLLNIFLRSVGPLLLFVLTNYLISSITEGNGKLKTVYISTICSFAPVLLFMPFVILLSNFVVDSEAFIYNMPRIVLWVWSFSLMYFMVKDIQDLQFGENNKNIILTILTMILFIAFGFLLYILGDQLFSFIGGIIKEVLSRG